MFAHLPLGITSATHRRCKFLRNGSWLSLGLQVRGTEYRDFNCNSQRPAWPGSCTVLL